MIYTVTLNPSIDYVVQVADFRSGKLNRTQKEIFFPGGKGNNVSMVLNHLGIESTALGFVAGFTGSEIESMLQQRGIRTDYVRLAEGNSRVNVKMHSLSDSTETEVNGSGPEIPESALEKLIKKLCRLKKGDTLVLAGSIPGTVRDTVYEEICMRLEGSDVRIVVDAEKQLLEKVLKYRPYLVKPNHHELGAMFGVELQTREDAVFYAEKLKEMGACNVIVSMAGEGAVLVGEQGEVFVMNAPEGTVVNSVGAGDSMVAGFLAGIDRGAELEEAFRLAVCCGSACAFVQGLPTREEIEKIQEESEGK